MAPIRRYLRITKHSVLECRIYLENPSLAHSWLLHPRNPVLPRVIEAVRPWALPKLREERERAKSKRKSAKRSIKDVVTTDEFEVAIFLTETDTRHSLVVKHKHFRDKVQAKLTSNSSRLMGASSAAPIDLGEIPALAREDSDEVDLAAIPAIGGEADPQLGNGGDDEEDEDALLLMPDAADSNGGGAAGNSGGRGGGEGTGDGKKLGMDVSYEGFAIYGRVLCLMIKRRDGRPQRAMMEDWIASTQMPPEELGT